MEGGPPHLGAELLAGFRAGRGGPQEAHDVEDAGETMLSFYDLDADRDYEANDVHVGQQALRVKVDADFFNRFPDDFDEDDMRPPAPRA